MAKKSVKKNTHRYLLVSLLVFCTLLFVIALFPFTFIGLFGLGLLAPATLEQTLYALLGLLGVVSVTLLLLRFGHSCYHAMHSSFQK